MKIKIQSLVVSVCMLILCCTLSNAQTVDPPVPVPSDSTGNISQKKNRVYLFPGFGASLVRNSFAPVFYISLGYKLRDTYEVNVNTSSYFFFEQSDGSAYNIYRNTFLNAEFLLNFSPFTSEIENWNGIGLGYLVEAKGQVFQETTFQVYYRKKLKFISLTGGIVFDDNFENAFPMIGVRF
jgi:hypothetical protein